MNESANVARLKAEIGATQKSLRPILLGILEQATGKSGVSVETVDPRISVILDRLDEMKIEMEKDAERINALIEENDKLWAVLDKLQDYAKERQVATENLLKAFSEAIQPYDNTA